MSSLSRRSALATLVGTAAAATVPASILQTRAATAATVSQPRVMAHYMPCFPTSLDNAPTAQDYYQTQYLQPTGENSRYAKTGGYLRDRPLGVPVASGDWRVVNAAREVATAKAYAIDGFTVDILTLSGQFWDNAVALWHAAEATSGFCVMPTVDMDALRGTSASEIAAALAPLMKSRAAARIDGRVALSAFRPESQPVTFWMTLISLLRKKIGSPVAFHAVLLDSSATNVDSFARISTHIGSWGPRSPEAVADEARVQSLVVAAGAKWIGVAATQDYRQVWGVYSEASNTETLRRSWQMVTAKKAAWVHITTWNDYSENTGIAPSVNHGYSWLRMTRTYARRFKGQGDSREEFVVLSARRQFARTIPTLATSRATPTLSFPTTPTDRVEVFTQTVRPVTLVITVGNRTTRINHAAGAQVSTHPLGAGAVRVRAERAGAPVSSTVSTPGVLNKPQFGDYSYYAGSATIR